MASSANFSSLRRWFYCQQRRNMLENYCAQKQSAWRGFLENKIIKPASVLCMLLLGSRVDYILANIRAEKLQHVFHLFLPHSPASLDRVLVRRVFVFFVCFRRSWVRRRLRPGKQHRKRRTQMQNLCFLNDPPSLQLGCFIFHFSTLRLRVLRIFSAVLSCLGDETGFGETIDWIDRH